MNVSSVVVLIASLVALGALARPLATRLRLPVSILWAAGGAALGFACHYSLQNPGGLLPVELATAIVDLPIGSSLFLYVFLPTLIFQSALEVDLHRVREDLLPILLLALVAVVVATFGVALFLWPIAGMSLLACLLLASLVATTDPVAVIAIFRDVGAPERLTRLVEGESLFNDAAAISLALIFSAAIIAPGSVGLTGAIKDLVLLPIGGVLLGLGAAWLFIQLLKLIGEDRVTTASLSLALPYLSFWVAERVVGVSGVVAVATAGVALASLAPGRVTGVLWRHLSDTWQQLASWSSILIFVLTSLLLPRLLSDLRPFDFVLLLVVFAAALLTRALVLFGMLPLLTRFGLSSPISIPYRVVVLWGGLRGSMTLALALAVLENPAIPRPIATFVVTLATGFTLMTLLVQGTTLRPLIQRLGLDRLNDIDRSVRDLALDVAGERVRRFADDMADRFGHAPADQLIPARPSDTAGIPPPGSTAGELPQTARTAIALVALTAHEREMILEHFADGTVAPPIARRLAADARRRLDLARSGGMDGYRSANAAEIDFAPVDRIAFALQRRFGYSRPLSRRLAIRFEMLIEASLVVGSLSHVAERELQPVLGSATIAEASEVLAERLGLLEREIAAVRLQYPAYVTELERGFVVRAAQAVELVEIERLRRSGVISSEVERDVLAGRTARGNARFRRPTLDLGLDTATLIERSDLFAELSARERQDLAPLMRPFFAEPGMRIIRRGEIGDAAYFISSGAVEIDTGASLVRLGRGDIFGEMALLFDQRRQADVSAIAYCALLRLSAADFQRFLALHPALKKRIEAIALQRRDENAAGSVPPEQSGTVVAGTRRPGSVEGFGEVENPEAHFLAAAEPVER
ncbi:cation:proton antiporter [Aurantimonas endophytica]|uniref:CPA1 family monovalent cation:H+ antiporter n=1 Tax=Aurantimonas endophytica TaxID=1522175 RepID=A0A7W6HAS2_9HYPH|nr:cation:proton antiporter [Aurantimonas endophytica]MBB4001764.1 CPA1 family monovalent cation:H+ antiporter [Aurantimonas endophytica]